ncbi:MAG TPA: type II toxin-antitoxin system RelE/ParE family toxin [Vicinamibacterales bacterium]
MASYRLLIKPSAAKELEAVPLKDRKRVVTKIQQLASDPRPDGTEKLSGQDKYRLRQGNYRVLYAIDDAHSEVVIVKIGHRRECTVGDHGR